LNASLASFSPNLLAAFLEMATASTRNQGSAFFENSFGFAHGLVLVDDKVLVDDRVGDMLDESEYWSEIRKEAEGRRVGQYTVFIVT